MKFIFGFLFAWFFFFSSPMTIAYMFQYVSNLHHVLHNAAKGKIIEELQELQRMSVPKKQTHLEST